MGKQSVACLAYMVLREWSKEILNCRKTSEQFLSHFCNEIRPQYPLAFLSGGAGLFLDSIEIHILEQIVLTSCALYEAANM